MSGIKKSLPVVNGKITTAPGATIEGRDTNGDGVVDTVIMSLKKSGFDFRGTFSSNGHLELRSIEESQFLKKPNFKSTLNDSVYSPKIVEAWKKAVKGDNSVDPSELGTFETLISKASNEAFIRGKKAFSK